MHVWCINLCFRSLTLVLIHVCVMHISMFLDPWLWCMCVWCTYPWSWTLILKHVCMLHVWYVCVWCVCVYDANVPWPAYILYACMYDAYTYVPWPLCICAWCINVWCIHLWSLILVYAACVYDAANFVPDQRTNERTDKAILGVWSIDCIDLQLLFVMEIV